MQKSTDIFKEYDETRTRLRKCKHLLKKNDSILKEISNKLHYLRIEVQTLESRISTLHLAYHRAITEESIQRKEAV